MILLRNLFKSAKIKLLVVPIAKLSSSIVFCENYKKNTTQNVYLFGSRSALPEGSTTHPLFEGENKWRIVGFGPRFGVALDKLNNVYLWGTSKYHNDYIKPFLLCKISGVVDCQCSSNEIFFLKNDGTVWTAKGVDKLLDNQREARLEKMNEFPNTLLFNEPKIVKMSIGQKHSAFISDDGSLYCSGNNEYGQCGCKPLNLTTESTFLVYSNDEKKEDIVPLRKVEFKEKVKIKDAVCGATHTLCIDTQNNIYSFGDDSSIQLFFGDSRGRSNKFHRDYAGFFKDKDYGVTSPIVYGQKERHLQYVPVKVNNLGFLDKYQQIIKDSTVKLAAGDGFTVISIQLDDERANESVILSSGNNTLGQCGTLDTTTYVAKKVKLPDKSNCEEITCGKAHCMVLTKSNKIWAWGNNQEDQIYQMKKNIVHTPESVKLAHTGESSREPKVEYIKCSYNNSVIITS